jgi:hypothetical protein
MYIYHLRSSSAASNRRPRAYINPTYRITHHHMRTTTRTEIGTARTGTTISTITMVGEAEGAAFGGTATRLPVA